MEIPYIHPLYMCIHILYFTYIPVYISICPRMIYKLTSHHIGRAKLVLSINSIFFVVCNALIEPIVNWGRHRMLWFGRTATRSSSIVLALFIRSFVHLNCVHWKHCSQRHYSLFIPTLFIIQTGLKFFPVFEFLSMKVRHQRPL